ncbi:9629_t:CDS:2 [Funneliformis geosporum]|uniref:353_t:CDS:1 n=1 Tax=Funneliformis geosporum TaxID=1117311 RepID=A0A9W4T642_9GLOM|nr:9629_t:CDS:2 [Funneliformis geosporum]CAI2194389.1 353_t:CDS:2 [Funneliformis geosporum]
MSASSTTTQSKPPLRSERNLCWKLRDEYFECLEKITPLINNNTSSGGDIKLIVDPILVQDNDEIQKLVKKFNCWKKKEEYEKACITSWVEYFNTRRQLELKQRAENIKETGKI